MEVVVLLRVDMLYQLKEKRGMTVEDRFVNEYAHENASGGIVTVEGDMNYEFRWSASCAMCFVIDL
jgi:hypothetical protein